MSDEPAIEPPSADIAETETRRKDSLQIAALTISIKALLILFAGQTYQVSSDKRLAGLYEWLAIWNRWDSLHYLRLAEQGYSAVGDTRPYFFPLYPWMIRAVTWITTDYLVSAFLISAAASIAAAIILHRIVCLDHSRKIAIYAVWFFLIFPTSYFLHIGYTESLFLMLVFGCIYAARTNRWVWAGVIGALACLTRANGLVLVLALAAEICHQYWVTKKLRIEWLSVALIPLGFVGYLALNLYATGNAFTFIAVRQEIFFISTAPPWTGISAVIGQLNMSPANAEMVGVQEIIFISLGFFFSVVSLFKLRPIYSVWTICSWLLFVSVTFVAGLPRYTLTMFPIFILFALLSKQRMWFAIITFWSLIYFGFFSSQFAKGSWGF